MPQVWVDKPMSSTLLLQCYDLDLDKMTLFGHQLKIQEGMRDGVFRIFILSTDVLVFLANAKTVVCLNSAQEANSYLVLSEIWKNVLLVKQSGVASMKDYSKFFPGGRVSEVRKPEIRPEDRYDRLTFGLKQLSSQMNKYVNGRGEASADQKRDLAKTYSEMMKLRTELVAMLNRADGMLEVVQTQMRDVME